MPHASFEVGPSPRHDALLAALVSAFLALVWGPAVSMDDAWGWDESMNAAYPGARIALALRDAAPSEVLRTVHDCRQYPFVVPLLLGLVQTVTGVSEFACRVVLRWLWCAGLFGLFLLVRRVASERGPPGTFGVRAAPWLALSLAAASPMAWAYAGSLFLEIPFAVVSVVTAIAWLRRGPQRSLGREAVAGTWATVALFTKFNYGLLLGFALFLDLAVDAIGELRAGRGRSFLRRTGVLALPPVLGLVWWFGLPLPYGAAEAAAHREAFRAFLGGNTDPSMDIPGSIRALHWTAFLAVTPRVLAIQLLAAATTVTALGQRGVRLLWILFLAGGLPVWTHNFHLDRFLLPGAVPLWCLAGLGLAQQLGAAASPAPGRPGPGGTRRRLPRLGRGLGDACGGPVRRAAQRLPALGPGGVPRPVPGPADPDPWPGAGGQRGLPGPARTPRDAGDPRGWIGMSNVFSPGAMHLGLLERGAGDPGAVRRGDLDRTFVDIGFADPGWPAARVQRWGAGFDLLLTTEPIDLTRPGPRAFLKRYRTDLMAAGGWRRMHLGRLTLRRADGEAYGVDVYACRRSP